MPLKQPEPLREYGPADPGNPPVDLVEADAPTISSRMTNGVHRSPSTVTPTAIGQ